MAYKGYKTRFPLRKLNRKRIFKKGVLPHISQPRAASRGRGGISRRGKG
ncbi:MAG: hypothetical protein U9O41_02775 [Candidatus Aerophobetes bacterium]|nr:hypothetical protein [Candidatus Aerophobetes bacterium]